MLKRRMVIEAMDEKMAESLRRKTPAQRLSLSFEMWRSAYDQLHYLLRVQNPDWNEQRIKAELRRRLLGPA